MVTSIIIIKYISYYIRYIYSDFEKCIVIFAIITTAFVCHSFLFPVRVLAASPDYNSAGSPGTSGNDGGNGGVVGGGNGGDASTASKGDKGVVGGDGGKGADGPGTGGAGGALGGSGGASPTMPIITIIAGQGDVGIDGGGGGGAGIILEQTGFLTSIGGTGVPTSFVRGGLGANAGAGGGGGGAIVNANSTVLISQLTLEGGAGGSGGGNGGAGLIIKDNATITYKSVFNGSLDISKNVYISGGDGGANPNKFPNAGLAGDSIVFAGNGASLDVNNAQILIIGNATNPSLAVRYIGNDNKLTLASGDNSFGGSIMNAGLGVTPDAISVLMEGNNNALELRGNAKVFGVIKSTGNDNSLILGGDKIAFGIITQHSIYP